MWNKSLRINCDKLSLSAFAGVAPAIMRGFVAVFLCLWGVIAHAETSESSAFAPTIPNKSTPPREAPEGMVWVPGGEFSMGAAAPLEAKSCLLVKETRRCRAHLDPQRPRA